MKDLWSSNSLTLTTKPQRNCFGFLWFGNMADFREKALQLKSSMFIITWSKTVWAPCSKIPRYRHPWHLTKKFCPDRCRQSRPKHCNTACEQIVYFLSAQTISTLWHRYHNYVFSKRLHIIFCFDATFQIHICPLFDLGMFNFMCWRQRD